MPGGARQLLGPCHTFWRCPGRKLEQFGYASDMRLEDGHVAWVEVAPRDGLQNHPSEIPTQSKIELIRRLLAAGADMVEATSFVSPRLVPRMADASKVMTSFSPEERRRLRVLVPNLTGAGQALEAGALHLAVTIGATDAFNQRNVNRPVRDSVHELEAICMAASAGGATVEVVLSVAFGCPFQGEVSQEQVIGLAQSISHLEIAGICLADTIGVAAPAAVVQLVKVVRGATPIPLALHFHDTRGLGVANVLAGFGAGVRQFEGSVGGIGGCPFAPRSTGNVASEDAIFGLTGAGASTDIDVDAYCETAAWLAAQLGETLPGKLYRAGTSWIVGEN